MKINENKRKIYIPLEDKEDNIKYLKINISYDKGGANYYYGGNDKRGIKIYFKRVELTQHTGYTMESFKAGGSEDGFKMTITEQKRLNTNKLNKYFKVLVKYKDKLKDLFFNKNYDDLNNFICLLNKEVIK